MKEYGPNRRNPDEQPVEAFPPMTPEMRERFDMMPAHRQREFLAWLRNDAARRKRAEELRAFKAMGVPGPEGGFVKYETAADRNRAKRLRRRRRAA